MAYKILLTDDDELMLIALEELLGAEGFEVFTAANGRDALHQAQATHFDLIVLDVIMPGMMGFEVCRQLRLMNGYTNIPIIMLTAKSGETDRVKGMESGAHQFLPKPIHPGKLLQMIKDTLLNGCTAH